MKKIISIIIALMVVFLIGGCSKMIGTPSKQEMIKVVKSEEAKRVIEKNLRNLDKNALTDNGLIRSYGIDYDSVRYNPMGGVMFNVYVNNNKDMMVYFTLTKDYKNDLTNAGGGITKELSMLLGRQIDD